MATKALLLAAGYGERLSPLTDVLPKCLMPINKKPILEFWIDNLISYGIESVLVNVHYFSEEVINFLSREKFNKVVHWVQEEKLLGTAGTLRANREFFEDSNILFVHADNFCLADMSSFIRCHENRPEECVMTMMTFITEDPSSCGIVETDSQGIVTNFYEKVEDPPSTLANAAVYLLGKDFLDWFEEHEEASDFSLGVLPKLLGRIKTWNNKNMHIDIGTIENLIKAQDHEKSIKENLSNIVFDDWFINYLENPIHKMLNKRLTHEQK